MATLAFRSVEKSYRTRSGGIRAVQDVSFEVGDSEFVSIVGPSGCGKSTLLKMCAGLVPRTSGEILVDGRLVTDVQTQMGIAFQDSLLLEWRTVLSNVLLQIESRKLPTAQYEQRARELLKTVGMLAFADAYLMIAACFVLACVMVPLMRKVAPPQSPSADAH